MTKYEWFSELKRNISRLPDDEIKRVTEYYDELFEDNIERGKSEREIVREFGNPFDVACKIISEYDGELKSADVFDTPPKKSERPRVFDEVPDSPSVFDEPKESKPTGGAATVAKNDGVDKRSVKFMIFIVVNIVTGFAPVWITLAAWIVLGALTVAGVAISIGGIGAAVISFGPMFTGDLGSGIAQLGMSLALIGVGIAIALLCVYVIKQFAKLTAFCVKSLFAKE